MNYLHIAVSLKVELSETAYVASAIDMDSELTKEIDDSRGTRREGEPQNKWSENNRQKLLNEYQNLHLKEFPKLLMDLLRNLINLLFES